jgi:hypothetical protein
MRALGIVLLVFNLLAGGAFSYFALKDWKGRQEITAAGLRNYLVLAGLPLGDRPDDPQEMPADNPEEPPVINFYVEMQGGVPVTTVGSPVLKAYFQQASGASEGKGPSAGTVGTLNNKPVDAGPVKPLGGTMPVPNQLAEVRRVYTQVKTLAAGAGDQSAKAALLGGWLIFQMETYEGRVEVLRLIQTENGAKLQELLFARFDRVLNPPAAPTAAPPAAKKDEKDAARPLPPVRDADDRRAAIAHLLVHLDQDSSWQKRVAMVVGLRKYVVAVATQAVRMADMTSRVVGQLYADSRNFEREYMQLEQLAMERTSALMDLKRDRAALEKQRDRIKDEVARITTQLEGSGDLKGLKRLLQEIRAEVDGMLAQQAQIEGRLFDVQKDIALTLEDIYRLEAEVYRLEREKFGAK